jgi:hypothetical protein
MSYTTGSDHTTALPIPCPLTKQKEERNKKADQISNNKNQIRRQRITTHSFAMVSHITEFFGTVETHLMLIQISGRKKINYHSFLHVN